MNHRVGYAVECCGFTSNSGQNPLTSTHTQRERNGILGGKKKRRKLDVSIIDVTHTLIATLSFQ
jgi:hypothetical protein